MHPLFTGSVRGLWCHGIGMRPFDSGLLGVVRSRLAMLTVVLVQACGGRQQPATSMSAPHTRSAEIAESAVATEPPPEPLRRLESSVAALAHPSEDPRHAAVVHALRDLADALSATPGGRGFTPIHLRDMARRLDASLPSALSHADIVKKSLTMALRALLMRTPPPERAREYLDSFATIRHRIDALDPDLPLRSQQRVTAAAFRAVADAVFLAVAKEPPFGEAKAEARAATTARTFDGIEDARTNVLGLGRAKWPMVRWATARVLSSIADIIESHDVDGAQADRLSTIRFEAERLRITDTPVFVEAEWVKRGLTTALDALDDRQADMSARDRAIVLPWASSARRAVGQIREDEPLSFQRGAIQDGFRATVDAFAAASLPR